MNIPVLQPPMLAYLLIGTSAMGDPEGNKNKNIQSEMNCSWRTKEDRKSLACEWVWGVESTTAWSYLRGLGRHPEQARPWSRAPRHGNRGWSKAGWLAGQLPPPDPGVAARTWRGLLAERGETFVSNTEQQGWRGGGGELLLLHSAKLSSFCFTPDAPCVPPRLCL